MSMANQPLQYADFTADSERPHSARHSNFSAVAIFIYMAVALGKIAVVLYGIYRWQPLFRYERLYDRVVAPYGLLKIAMWAYFAGASFALCAILIPRRERQLAVFSFMLNFISAMYLMYDEYYGFFGRF